MSNDQEDRVAEETRLRERAQHWAAELMKANDSNSPDAAAVAEAHRDATKAYEQFMSGLDNGEVE